ncbi:MAG: hypothetical protein HYS22_08025 [Deltaproteobacteria bacterium]|nr:hypothetical protein [Deltaproteobacteria bacterium]
MPSPKFKEVKVSLPEDPHGKVIYKALDEQGYGTFPALSEALNDSFSPGVIDETELLDQPSLRQFCSLREKPPLMTYASYLTDRALGKRTLLQAVGNFLVKMSYRLTESGRAAWSVIEEVREDDRVVAATRFLAVIQNQGLLSNLPEESVTQLMILASEIFQEAPDVRVKRVGENLVGALGVWKTSHHEPPLGGSPLEVCPPPQVYTFNPTPLPPVEALEMPDGLDSLIRYWHWVYFSDRLWVTYARKFSKGEMSIVNYKGEGFGTDREGETYRLTVEQMQQDGIGFKVYTPSYRELERSGKRHPQIVRIIQRAAEEEKERLDEKAREVFKKRAEKDGEVFEGYNYLSGREADITAAATRFSAWQVYLEVIFEEAFRGALPDDKLPDSRHLAKLAIIESEAQANPPPPNGSCATGPYQIVVFDEKKRGRRRYNEYCRLEFKDPKFRYGLEINQRKGIDERRNFIFSGQAAARILRQGFDAVVQDGYIRKGVGFDRSQALWVSTSTYHAGIGTLRIGLRGALDDMIRKKEEELARKEDGNNGAAGKKGRSKKRQKPPPIPLPTAADVFKHLFTSPLRVARFRDDSKDYPPQLWPAIEAAESLDAGKRLPFPLLVVVELAQISQPIPFQEMVDQLSRNGFQPYNPQYDEKQFYTSGNSNGQATLEKRARFLLRQGDVKRLTGWLVGNNYVSRDQIRIIPLKLPDAVQVREDRIPSSPLRVSPAVADAGK